MADMQIVVANKKLVEPQYVEMMVPLYSYGCERKVKKTLSHLKGMGLKPMGFSGIYSVTVEYDQQKVIVWGICNKFDVLSMMRSKRKEARFWNSKDNIEMQAHDDEAEAPVPRKDVFGKPSLSLMKARSLSWKACKDQFNKPSLALMKARSLSCKAWKKVFTRSYSF